MKIPRIRKKIRTSIFNVFFTLIISFTCINFSFAQRQGNVRLSFIGERMQYENRIVQSYGLYAEIYISDWWSLGYHFSFGSVLNENRAYGHFTLGARAAAYPFRIFIDTEEELFLYLAILAIALPESANFHIRASENFHISPFIAPLGVDYYKTEDDRDNYQASFAAGLRFNIFYDNISIAPFAGVRKIYRERDWAIIGGAMIGISF